MVIKKAFAITNTIQQGNIPPRMVQKTSSQGLLQGMGS